jgi:hypothetical protein
MASAGLRDRLPYFYALLTGTIGLVILIRLFADQVTAIDLATLLAFTLTALILSYFRVPIGKANGELGLDGAIVLGATLAGGAALGGWVAFVTGLVTNLPLPSRSAPAQRRGWVSSASTALLDGGRNVIATALAWWAYLGLEGGAVPTTMDMLEILSVVVMCLTFALVRGVWQWPLILVQDRSARSELATLSNLSTILLELIPLPVALLTAATFVELGWSFFLLLVFVFAGLGALLRQMLVKVYDLQDQLDTLELTNELREKIEAAPPEVGTLCTVAYDLCQRLVPAPKFELGLYDGDWLHVNIQVSVNNDAKLPPMRIPVTPQWAWLGECSEPQLFLDRGQVAQLPFSLPPIGEDQSPQTAMFVPIAGSQTTRDDQPLPPAIGGIVLTASRPDAFTEQDLAHVAVVAELVGNAIQRARHRPSPQD